MLGNVHSADAAEPPAVDRKASSFSFTSAEDSPAPEAQQAWDETRSSPRACTAFTTSTWSRCPPLRRPRRGRAHRSRPWCGRCSPSWATTRPARGYARRRRAEERRVGKECRSRWSAYHEENSPATDDYIAMCGYNVGQLEGAM